MPHVTPEELAVVLTGPDPPPVVQMSLTIDRGAMHAALEAHAAARARGESAKVVMDELIGRVAEALAPDGFRVVRGKRLIKRRRGEWTDEIGFWVSRRNMVGIGIEFNVTALVRHATFGKRRAELGLRAGHSGFGKDTSADIYAHHHHLAPTGHPEYHPVWDIAAVDAREPATREVAEKARAILLPWFDGFAGEDAQCELLVRGAGEDANFDTAAEYLLCFRGPDAIAEMVDSLIQAHPEWRASIQGFLERGRREGMRELNGFIREPEASIARVILRFDLPIPPALGGPARAARATADPRVRGLGRHPTRVSVVRASPTEDLVAMASGDGLVSLESSRTRERVAEARLGSAADLAFSRDGRRLLGLAGGEVVTWEVPSLIEVERLQLEAGSHGGVLSRDGAVLVTRSFGRHDTFVSVRQIADGKDLLYERLSGVGVGSALVGEHLVLAVLQRAALREAAIEVRRVPSFELVRCLVAPSGFVRPLLSADARYLAAAGTGVVWERESGAIALQVPAVHPTVCEFGHGGALFATTSPDGALRVWNVPAGREHASVDIRPHIRFAGSVTALAFSRDDRTVFVGAEDGAVLSWDLG